MRRAAVHSGMDGEGVRLGIKKQSIDAQRRVRREKGRGGLSGDDCRMHTARWSCWGGVEWLVLEEPK